MKVSSGEMQALQVFRAQYFQLLDLVQMRWPEAQLLKRPDVQAWLFAEMFDRDSIQYPPPERYQMRVLKRVVSTIEQAIDNPEEDELSDDLMSSLSLLLGSNLPSESASAQTKSYVTYNFGNDRAVTLLESRAVISSSGTTGLRTWEAALHLGAYLASESGQQWVRGKRVLELGAGTGLLSILCTKHLQATKATATDGDEGVVDSIKTNLFLNGLDAQGSTDSIVLRWGWSWALEESLYYEGSKDQYDVVLGADVTYDKAVIPVLVSTLADLLQHQPSLQILIAATIRNEQTFEAFDVACRRNKLSVEDMDFAPPPGDDQNGPFYPTSTPIRIIQVSKTGDTDPFAVQ
ncbi:Nicotinamide N-methyltransferase [Lasiodiplodia theobromae]|uniref:Protein-lysine N-methyltransferase EFM3 n=1 Tax=Lasiodiplodia theobromae TaxID=45133 RepID=A0A5N5DLE2_9PEZI|nr:Nicotinamide N-methyltransferase [Lasiodiplodia theobromae]KAB2578729.1 Protein-lysine N-methyltransferase EFM3 [Lasiodiplodia theobromae]KAF4535364.1 Nicotinamide N-methyltransferase [Lasiodiplodia theobromae]